jgi:hypothetical protein
MQYLFAKHLFLNIFFLFSNLVSLSPIYPSFPLAIKPMTWFPLPRLNCTGRLMDMPPYGKPLRVYHRAWTTLRVAHISTSL